MFNPDLLLFGIFPYVAFALAVVVTIYRYRVRRFSFSSLSSQLLERKLLFWGSIPFHWGMVLILAAHLAALVLPSAVLGWNASPTRLYLLEATGLALGLWSLAGLGVLAYRRLSVSRIQAVSTGMDLAVLAVLGVQLLTGVGTALTYRWGSNWFAAVASPYLWSLAGLAPRLELVAPLPLLVKVHIANFFVFLAIFPFTRLVHIVTVPVQYLWRPWQVLVWNRAPGRVRPPVPVAGGFERRAREIHVPGHDAVPQLKPRAADGQPPQ